MRPIETTDAEAIRAFLTRCNAGGDVPRAGLLAKLVGDLVAVMAIDVAPAAIRIERLVVAPELRRKRIGRAMIDEVAGLATKMERDWLIVEHAGDAREFFRRTGFTEEGTCMKRRVR